MNWIIGIDLGATKVALGLISPDDRIVARCRIPTEASAGPYSAVERIAQCIAQLQGQVRANVTAVGICSPGPVDHVSGVILDPPNLPTWRDVPFRDMLSRRVGLPVALEHDAKAAALGEFYFGAGHELKVHDLVYVIVGTGIGAAIILDGELYRGRTNSAGEIGHITLNREGEPGSSGVPGCTEVYAGGPYIERHFARLTGNRCGGEEIARLAVEGDAAALRVMTEAGDALGAAIATTAMMMDVSLFVIGGSVAKAGDVLLEPARAAVPKYAFQSVASRVRIVATKLHEEGAILGSGWLARQKIED